jgi:hypothetical protein
MIPTPLIQYIFARYIRNTIYESPNIYNLSIYSLNISVGRAPLERKYQNSSLCIQPPSTTPEINYLNIIIMISIISKAI